MKILHQTLYRSLKEKVISSSCLLNPVERISHIIDFFMVRPKFHLFHCISTTRLGKSEIKIPSTVVRLSSHCRLQPKRSTMLVYSLQRFYM